ncbi:hypothetical protein TSTA_075820 [Talaromyces stipitatus ATCC 10500]|uniref:Glycosyl hydrolase family 67 C-terminal domain-containing protein n=1 Tax=Talaromyces stipitatus (strain ATCC 10500 / CBS 375.48 / QM 6759 / NRRL 1006) TaxID=441959 RepID=B8LVS9_TALSN|nr:uncharacterized protein TSTA_075820 [Talaromyces stipitatus ATCC 10500]EED24209.1 hypothetical protein TSTA_075820 [Talaromyces stipitatus ATCC 10500]
MDGVNGPGRIGQASKLQSGKTVIQHFYDAHYTGAAAAQTFPTKWETLKDKIDDERPVVWRDAITEFYHNLSGIPDDTGRVGTENYPWRIQGENMDLVGYTPYVVNPFETASNFTTIITTSNTTAGTASTHINFPTGKYDIAVNYYDVIGGI